MHTTRNSRRYSAFLMPLCICLLATVWLFSGEEAPIKVGGEDASTLEMDDMGGKIFDPGKLKPVDSALKVKVGEAAPDFTLPSIKGKKVSLSDYKGKKNVLISFVPAAWTPVCSGQWPGYRLIEKDLADNDTVILGITVDNIPSLHAWVTEMDGLFFPVLSDFNPHGKVSKLYGVLRSDGTSERATFLIDKQGIIRHINVNDINTMPDLEALYNEVVKLGKE